MGVFHFGKIINTGKLTHYTEIDVTNLNVLKPRASIFLLPDRKPLDIMNVIISFERRSKSDKKRG